MSSQPAIETICSTLNEKEERPRSQVTAIVEALGEARAMALLAETQRIELSGGMLVPDGSRRRTPGGVFFFLARRALPPQDRDRIFSENRQRPPPAEKPAAPAAVPAPARGTPPANNGFSARRFEHRSNHSSGSYADGAYAHRTSTYTAHGSSRQTTVEFSSRLPLRSVADASPAPEPAPPPPPPPRPPTADQGQRLVPLRRRIVSLPALETETKKPEAENAAEPAPAAAERGSRRRRAGATTEAVANDTTPAQSDTPDLARARAAIRGLGSADRRNLMFELVDDLGSDRDPTKAKFGLRDLVVSRLGAALDVARADWAPLLGLEASADAASSPRPPVLAPDQLERIDRFVTLLVDSLDGEGEAAAESPPSGAKASGVASNVGSELESRTRQFVNRLHTLVRSATLQSVQQAFAGRAAAAPARRSSAPPPSRRAGKKKSAPPPARAAARTSGRRKPKRRR